MARPPTPLLTQTSIVDAAVELIEDGGLEQLSMRRLAMHLGVQAPSLYNHFGTKDDVLDAVAIRFYDSLDLSAFEELDWRRALETFHRSYWSSLTDRRDFLPIIAFGRRARPGQLRIANAYHGALLKAGWPPFYATQIAASLRAFVLGSAIAPLGQRFINDPGIYAEYPHLQDAHRLGGEKPELAERAFNFGLELMLSSLQELYDRVVGDGTTDARR